MKPSVLLLIALISSSAMAMEFDANGKRLDNQNPPVRQYRWTDPKTGKIVIKAYPPANLPMRQVKRSPDGLMTDLEVIVEEAPSNLEATVAASKLSSDAQGGLRESETWLATEPERKAAEEAARIARIHEMEHKAEAEEMQWRVDQAQTNFDNEIKLQTLKAMTAPRVIILQHRR